MRDKLSFYYVQINIVKILIVVIRQIKVIRIKLIVRILFKTIWVG